MKLASTLFDATNIYHIFSDKQIFYLFIFAYLFTNNNWVDLDRYSK